METIIQFLIPTALAQASASQESAPGIISSVFDIFVKIGIIVGIFIIASLLARFVVGRIIKAMEKTDEDGEHKEMLVFAKRMIYITFNLTALAIGLGMTDIFGDLGWLLGALGLGIGFSLQSIIGNFVAGMALLMQKKIRIGDYINIGEISGIVTNVGARTTTVHDFDGTDVLVPNLDFFNKAVRIYTANTYRRIAVEIGVGYDSDFSRVYETIFRVLKAHKGVEQEPPPDILCDQIQDSNVKLIIRWWIPSKNAWWRLRSEILRDIFTELKSMNIDIAYPVRTLRIDEHTSGHLPEFLRK